MAEPLIQFKNVEKSFNGQKVLKSLDLSIHEGIITTIIGRSGVGKSVLLKHVAGLLRPDSGEIFYRDKNLLKMKRYERKQFKKRFSYMFQNLALFDSMTIFENVALPLEEKTKMTKGEIRKTVLDKLQALDLDGIVDKYPAEISGGMAKRVALARALIREPEFILFDEPATGLDPVRKNSVYGMIIKNQSRFGFTAVLVSHEIPDVFSISQRVAMLEDGKIVFDGTADEILKCTDPVVRNFIKGDETLEKTAQIT